MSELKGCSDGNCIIQKPAGMHTNGGCNCEKEIRRALGPDASRFIHALRTRQRQVAELEGSFSDASSPRPCCGEYETCTRACTPRGEQMAYRRVADAIAKISGERG